MLLMIILNTAMAMSLAMTVRKVVRSVEMRLWRMATSCVVLSPARDARERLRTLPRVGDTRTMLRRLGAELRSPVQ
mgnify:CR=1 FL=1